MTVHSLGKADTEFAYQEIFEEDIYRKHGITFTNGDVIFDVGANIGLLELFLNHHNYKVTVHAFEPIPVTFKVLESNIALHHINDIVLHNCGLARTSGTAEFTYFPRASCSSTLFPDDSPEEKARCLEIINRELDEIPTRRIAAMLKFLFGWTRPWIVERIYAHYYKRQSTTCTLETLGSIINAHDVTRIDLLKLDAERAEMEILDSMSASEWNIVKQAIIEVHDGVNIEPAAQMMRENGFDVIVDTNPFVHDMALLYALKNKAIRLRVPPGIP